MLLPLLTSLAVAEPSVPPSAADAEIIVWGDPFARWDRRFLVRTEVGFAPELVLPAERNGASRLTRVQLQVVLDCARDAPLLGANEEVDCIVEDIGLVALVARPGAHDLRVLEEADAAMTGARLQLQVTPDGGVANVDLEGLGPRNLRDRERVEAYRQLLSRVILPFHMGLPPAVHDGATWYEHDSRLMSMPSAYGSGGATRLAHFMNAHEGHLLVQTVGEGVLRPVVGVDSMSKEAGDAGATFIPRGEAVDTYEVAMHGVALFDRDTGILAERLWVIDGGLTAGSPHVLAGFRYHHQGHLRLLDDDEQPHVGPTTVARADAGAPGDIPVYRPLQLP